MAAEPPSEFAGVFTQVVAETMRRLDKLKKELARDCGMRPDRFSHLQSGTRRPAHREIVRIGQGLRLDDAAVNRLLLAAGFPPLSHEPDDVGSPVALVSRLSEPERAMARAEIQKDVALVGRTWDHYVTLQAHNEARAWADASELYQEGIELYWELQAMAARFLCQVNLAAAAAHPHLNEAVEAESRCREGLEAASAAGSRPFQVMLLTRLASIKRLRSDYDEAGRLYDRALAIIDEWGRGDGEREPGHPVRQSWRAHWTARIRRMQGVLDLFKGYPVEAIRSLQPSLEHFKRERNAEELSQVCYGLSWAYGLRGELEAARSWDRQGLDYAIEHNQLTGREDDRSLLQGHLYLGGDYLDLNDLTNARLHLEQALRLAGHVRLRQYHEVGRVHLLLGKLEMREEAPDAALPHLRAALEFFSRQQEQVLLATAHNAMGDFYSASGGVHLQRALDHYWRALQAARASQPPNRYYECAALVNICRIRVRGGLPPAELSGRRDGSPASEPGWEVDTLIWEAKELSRANRYRNHRARLAVVEADWALRGGDRGTAVLLAGDALHIAHNFSPPLLLEVRGELRRLALPEELVDAPVAAEEEAT